MAEWVEVGDGLLLAVEVTGPAHAPVWLHAHGVGSSGRFVQGAFAAPVHDLGYRLATYDLRGHGDSSPVRDVAAHAVEHHVADLVAVATAVGASVVGGVSLGAHAAVLAASRLTPMAVVACLPAWTGRTEPGVGPHAAVASRVRSQGVDAVIASLEADTSMAPWLHRTVLTDFRRADPASLAAALMVLDGARAPDLEDLSRMEAPLGVVGWPDDPGHPLAVAEAWAAATDGPLVTTSIASMEEDSTALGKAAVTCLRWLSATGVTLSHRPPTAEGHGCDAQPPAPDG